MKADLTIKGGMIFTATSVIEGSISIKDGTISAIGKDEGIAASETVIDATGKLIFPGVIDPHVHFRDPGLTQKEDFLSGTSAAAAGGVTTVMEMPNTRPLVDSVEVLESKKKSVEQKALVDFCLIAGAGPKNLDEIRHLSEAGAVYFKTIMGGYKPEERPDLAGMLTLDDGDLIQVMEAIADTGEVLAVHAESEDLRDYYTRRLKKQTSKDLGRYPESRPNIVEEEAVSRAILLARETNCRLHIVHVSAKETIELVNSAKARGEAVTFETCPQYLFLSSSDLKSLGPEAIMNPPIRTSDNRDALWQAVKENRVDFLATDHAPHTVSEKSAGFENMWEAPAGTIGVETFFPLMLHEAIRGRISFSNLVKLTSENVAINYGIYPRKGSLAIGSDADLVVVDPSVSHTITKESLHTKNKNSLFLNRDVFGTITHTILRGRVIMQNSRIVGEPGFGRFVRPDRSPRTESSLRGSPARTAG